MAQDSEIPGARPVEYYSPTGQFDAVGFTLAVIGAVIAGAGMGFLYGAFNLVMPLVYFCMVMVLLFGTVLGHVSFFLLKLGHVRHHGVATAVACVAGTSALYTAWAADRWIRLRTVGAEVPLSFHPAELGQYVTFFYENGMWGLMAAGPLSGAPLAFVWLAEAAGIFYCCAAIARKKLAATPYCESCRLWPRLTKGARYLIPNTSRAVTEQLRKGNVAALAGVQPSSYGAPLALRVDLAQCQKCNASVYLSLMEIAAPSSWQEFVWGRDKALVRHLRISPAEADELRAPPRLAKMAPPPRPKR